MLAHGPSADVWSIILAYRHSAAPALALTLLLALGTAAPANAGTVYGWGDDAFFDVFGEGEGESGFHSTPTTIPGAAGASAVANFEDTTYAVFPDGTIKAWGEDSGEALGDGPGLSGTDDDGKAEVPVAVQGVTDATQVSAGDFFGLARRSNGTAVAWGSDGNGQLGNDAAFTNQATPVPVSGLTGVKAVAAGGNFSLALLNDGTVMSWGHDRSGELGDGLPASNRAVPAAVPGLTGVKAIAAGDEFALALLDDGTVKAWGHDDFGQLGDGTAAAQDCDPTAGTLSCQASPVGIPGLSGVSAIAAGHYHALAVVAGGAMKSWGADYGGQLGDGAGSPDTCPGFGGGYACSDSPIAVGGGLLNGVRPEGGQADSVAVLSDGTVRAWGFATNGNGGEAANESEHQEDLPVVVSGLTGIDNATTGGDDGSRAYAVTGGSVAPPTNTAPPTIPSSRDVGQTAACNHGTWTGSPTSFVYSWTRDGVGVANEQAASYKLRSGDAGHTIRCRVVAHNAGGDSQPATSNALSVANAPPSNTSPPAIPSTGKVGDKVACKPGTWTGSPTSFAFSWTFEGSLIANQHGKTYTLGAGDAAHKIRCQVVARNAGGKSAPATSNALKVKRPASSCKDATRPKSAIKKSTAAFENGKLLLKGTASDVACGKRGKVVRVIVTIALHLDPSEGKNRCRFLVENGRALGPVRGCDGRPAIVFPAKGTSKWSLKIPATPPAATYTIRSLATDAAGNLQRVKRTGPNVIKLKRGAAAAGARR